MDKFFELISKLKELGIAAKLCGTSSADALREEWKKFLSENEELVVEIKAWGLEWVVDDNEEFIFAEGAEIEDSMEVAIFLSVCEGTITESSICENYQDFINALYGTEEKVAIAVADFILGNYINYITAEDIFSNEDEDESGEADFHETEADSDADTVGDKNAEIADADTNYDAK